MPLTEKQRRRRNGVQGTFLATVGSLLATFCGIRICGTGIKASWVANDPVWMGFFVGASFLFFGLMFLWDWLFARDLTPEEIRMRNMREDVQEERASLFGKTTNHHRD